jgi:hypothetical protein
VGSVEVSQHPLDHQLGSAIGIDRLLRMVFVQPWLLGDAIGGAGAGERLKSCRCFSNRRACNVYPKPPV